jgi:hypothetical protein
MHPSGGHSCHTAHNAIAGAAGGALCTSHPARGHGRRTDTTPLQAPSVAAPVMPAVTLVPVAGSICPTCQCRVPARPTSAERQRAYRKRSSGLSRRLARTCTINRAADGRLLKVCFAPDSGRTADVPGGPVCANRRHRRRSTERRNRNFGVPVPLYWTVRPGRLAKIEDIGLRLAETRTLSVLGPVGLLVRE